MIWKWFSLTIATEDDRMKLLFSKPALPLSFQNGENLVWSSNVFSNITAFIIEYFHVNCFMSLL